jgi:hypothetical protein
LLWGCSTDAIRELVEQGFLFPIHFAGVATNGSVMVMRFLKSADDIQSEVLVERLEKPGLVLPANFMFTDATGRVAVWTITADGQSKVLH